MAFENPIVGGTIMRIPAMQSPNFSMSDATGWAIMQDGSAYFFNITASGTITGASLVVDGASGGVFVYSGPPAHGNLIVSLAGAAGSDVHGNAYPEGINVTAGTIAGSSITSSTFAGTDFVINSAGLFFYGGAPAAGNLMMALARVAGSDSFGNAYAQGLTIMNSNGFAVVAGLTGGSPLIYFPTGRSQIHNSSALQTITMGTGASSYEQLQILGAQDSTQMDAVDTTWISSSSDGTTQPAQLLDFYHDPSGGFHFYRSMTFAGSDEVGSITGVQPATGSSRANPAIAEVWHQVGTTGNPAYGTGFGSNAAVDQIPRFRLDGLAGGICRLDGVLYTNAATAANAVAFILPAGYRPTIRKRFGGLSTNFSGNTLGAADVVVLPTGAVEMGPAASASGQQMVLDGIVFPVD